MCVRTYYALRYACMSVFLLMCVCACACISLADAIMLVPGLGPTLGICLALAGLRQCRSVACKSWRVRARVVPLFHGGLLTHQEMPMQVRGFGRTFARTSTACGFATKQAQLVASPMLRIKHKPTNHQAKTWTEACRNKVSTCHGYQAHGCNNRHFCRSNNSRSKSCSQTQA